MTTNTMTILGGSGKTGRRVAARLREDGYDVRPVSRSTSPRFDWTDERTWAPVLEGATGLYVVPLEEDGGERMGALVDQAERAGVRRLVLLSAREWADLPDDVALGREEAVRAAKTSWTILRPVWFAQGFDQEPHLASGIAAGQVVVGTGDGAHPFIDADDIAAVAAAALTGEGHHGRTYELSGPRAITAPEALAIISAATGREIQPIAVSLEEYRAHLIGLGYPEPAADVVVRLTALIRRGDDARLSDGVQQALGRPPRDFTEYAQQAAAAGLWG